MYGITNSGEVHAAIVQLKTIMLPVVCHFPLSANINYSIICGISSHTEVKVMLLPSNTKVVSRNK